MRKSKKYKKKDKKKVFEHLEEKYKARGKDFYFKSKRISEDVNVSKYIVGRVIMDEIKNGNDKIVLVRNPGHGSSLFKTEFGCIT